MEVVSIGTSFLQESAGVCGREVEERRGREVEDSKRKDVEEMGLPSRDKEIDRLKDSVSGFQ